MAGHEVASNRRLQMQIQARNSLMFNISFNKLSVLLKGASPMR